MVNDVVAIREGAVDVVPMTSSLASAITRYSIAQVAPVSEGLWRVSNISKVGAVRIGDAELRIEPKVPVGNLFHLLSRGQGWGDWWSDDVALRDSTDFTSLIAEAFLSHATRALRRGAIQGYIPRKEAEATIRGRILVGEQLRRRRGLSLPVELQFDDYTLDVAVNRLVRSAARRLLTGRLPHRVRGGLLRIDSDLSAATLLTRGVSLPEIAWDRLSQRYQAAVALAQLILTNGSLDHRAGGTVAQGFLLNLAHVFERFVAAEVTRAARRYGGMITAQHRSSLDNDSRLTIEPDLVWHDGNEVRAVLDAKYKAEKPSGFPNADIYQMIVYCVRHGLPVGHLVYAAGNEVPARYVIRNAGVTVVCHALRLDVEPSAISAQVDRVVEFVHRSAARAEVGDRPS